VQRLARPRWRSRPPARAANDIRRGPVSATAAARPYPPRAGSV